MNVWALEKSVRLKAILLVLVEQLGAAAICVDDSTDTVADGIWLLHPQDPQVRAYLYVHGQEQGCAGVHLEYPMMAGTPPVFEYSENLEPARLADVLAAHLDISQVNPVSWSGNI